MKLFSRASPIPVSHEEVTKSRELGSFELLWFKKIILAIHQSAVSKHGSALLSTIPIANQKNWFGNKTGMYTIYSKWTCSNLNRSLQ